MQFSPVTTLAVCGIAHSPSLFLHLTCLFSCLLALFQLCCHLSSLCKEIWVPVELSLTLRLLEYLQLAVPVPLLFLRRSPSNSTPETGPATTWHRQSHFTSCLSACRSCLAHQINKSHFHSSHLPLQRHYFVSSFFFQSEKTLTV